MNKKPTTKLKKKAHAEDDAIIKDLDMHLEDDLAYKDDALPAKEESQMQMDDSEGLVSRPQLKGERKPSKTDYTQPGTNNQSRTVIKE